MKFKNQHYPVLIAASHIGELQQISEVESGIKFGGSVTLAELEHTMKEKIRQLPGRFAESFQKAFQKHIQRYL